MKKRYFAVLAAALALLLPLVAFAAEVTGEIVVDQDAVSVKIPDEAARQGVTALRLSVYVQGEAPSFAFTGGWAVQEARYNAATGILSLYVASESQLFSGETLALGTVSGGTLGKPVPDSLELARGDGTVPTTPPPQPEPPAPEEPPTDQPKPDFSALDQLLQQAAGYSQSAYTADSYALLQHAVTQAQALRGRDDATAEEIAQAKLALENAIGSLVVAQSAASSAPPPSPAPASSSTSLTLVPGRLGQTGSSSGSRGSSADASQSSTSQSGSQSGGVSSADSLPQDSAESDAGASQSAGANSAVTAKRGLSWPLYLLLVLLGAAVVAVSIYLNRSPKTRRRRPRR